MTTSSGQPGEARSDEAAWARGSSTLRLADVPAGAINLNVDGRRVVGPLQGFGRLWQKTYRVRLEGAAVTPIDVVADWKERFTDFWPSGNRFYAPLSGLKPGEVAVLNLTLGGMPVSTGMLVLYTDEECFTLMTPQGHMESGWITFSAYEEDGCTVAQVQSIARANDPFYEIGLLLPLVERMMHNFQENFWRHTLTALAARHGVDTRGKVWVQRVCVDPRLQWSQARNIWHNAMLRTAAYVLAAPLRRVRALVRR